MLLFQCTSSYSRYVKMDFLYGFSPSSGFPNFKYTNPTPSIVSNYPVRQNAKMHHHQALTNKQKKKYNLAHTHKNYYRSECDMNPTDQRYPSIIMNILKSSITIIITLSIIYFHGNVWSIKMHNIL